MKLQSFAILSSFVATATIAIAAPSQAQSLTAFSFKTNSTYQVGQEKNDIFLTSIIQDGKTITQFNTVNSAKIVQQNSTTIGGKSVGLLSTNCGDNVANCVSAELPSNSQVVGALGNLNLNKIIDTEEILGNGIMDVFFQKPSDSFYLFERGNAMGSSARAGNSSLKVQGLDAQGNLIGRQFTIGKDMWSDAGYAIDTLEIGHAQKVGSFGLKSSNGMISGLRIITDTSGADFKVIAASTKVPEPASLLGFAAVGGVLAMRRRKLAK